MAKIIKKKFKIDGMTCTSCALNIDFDMEDLEGIKSSKTNYAKQESEIEYDEEIIDFSKIQEQIQKTGYQTR